MNNQQKEFLQERFEILTKTADDCIYMLDDKNKFTNEELKNKLEVRLDRIKFELNVIETNYSSCFEPVNTIN